MKGLRFVCSDPRQPCLQVITDQASQAVHVVDGCHVMIHLSAIALVALDSNGSQPSAEGC